MKVIQENKVENGKFIKTRTVSDFTPYEIYVLHRLYNQEGLVTLEDECNSDYTAVIRNLVKIGLIYEDYIDSEGTHYQIDKKCIEQLIRKDK